MAAGQPRTHVNGHHNALRPKTTESAGNTQATVHPLPALTTSKDMALVAQNSAYSSSGTQPTALNCNDRPRIGWKEKEQTRKGTHKYPWKATMERILATQERHKKNLRDPASQGIPVPLDTNLRDLDRACIWAAAWGGCKGSRDTRPSVTKRGCPGARRHQWKLDCMHGRRSA